LTANLKLYNIIYEAIAKIICFTHEMDDQVVIFNLNMVVGDYIVSLYVVNRDTKRVTTRNQI
jgi:hypothetical protein